MFDPDARNGRTGAIRTANTIIWFSVIAVVQKSCDGKVTEVNIVAGPV
jgi:hypothetical protein